MFMPISYVHWCIDLLQSGCLLFSHHEHGVCQYERAGAVHQREGYVYVSGNIEHLSQQSSKHEALTQCCLNVLPLSLRRPNNHLFSAGIDRC